MPASKAKQAETAGRRADLIRLRRSGVRFDDPLILALGYSSSGAARKDLIRALEQNRDEEAAEISVYRQQENERLDSLLEAVWGKATTPSPVFDREGMEVAREVDLKAVDTVLKLMDRRAKLNGLDMPVKAEVTGAEGGPLAVSTADPDKLAALIAATSRLDSDAPTNTATSTPADEEEVADE
ncbi:hypothetical protein [Streptomyces sp. sk2.1]|uniref:hypothetical protein n=1 Tax=Streptomyces sp. sk2.1 TaxID=2478959 RepID=UPI0011E60B15|nr:hypothetical protein [Streptomyces sp. sk2.1]TXS61187.1 hypothetical protein EAO76_41680 [Streptomyces sp. sk2.1]